ncbi:hypothetical protein EMCRGX_G009596 [Ephydatia muelleri]
MVFDSLHSFSHPGIRATQKLITARFVWPGINSNVRRSLQKQLHKHFYMAGSPVLVYLQPLSLTVAANLNPGYGVHSWHSLDPDELAPQHIIHKPMAWLNASIANSRLLLKRNLSQTLGWMLYPLFCSEFALLSRRI